MPVLTKKEYAELPKKLRADKKEMEQVAGVDKKIPAPDPKKTFRLLHPDTPVDRNLDFEDELLLEGKTYKRVCKSGMVVTDQDVLANFLMSKGYILIELIQEEEIIDA